MYYFDASRFFLHISFVLVKFYFSYDFCFHFVFAYHDSSAISMFNDKTIMFSNVLLSPKKEYFFLKSYQLPVIQEMHSLARIKTLHLAHFHSHHHAFFICL